MDRRLLIGSLAAMPLALSTEARPLRTHHGLGLNFMPKADFKKLKKVSGTRGAIPPHFTLLDKNILPPVGDQKQQDSCVGWAVGYGLASTLIRQKTGQPYLASPSFVYNRGMLLDSHANGWPYGCSTGMFMETALSDLQGFGILSESDYPYDQDKCQRLPRPDEDKAARSEMVLKNWKVAGDLSRVKDSIASETPALVGLNTRARFDTYTTLSANNVYSQSSSENIVGGHALLIVGYDDNLGAFQVMNSYGSSWGYQGFAWISYDTINQDALVDATAADKELRLYVVNVTDG